MAIFLNTNRGYENFNDLYNSKYFVDKSNIIESLNELINTSDKYVCITRPRRFAKSSVADMLSAYYSTCVDSSEIFNKLNISKHKSYESNLNKYNVISISFNEIDDNCKDCTEYITRVTELLKNDLLKSYPQLDINENYAIWDILSECNEKFIFILDEWDFIFNNNLFVNEQDIFLSFLMKLLKDKPYVSLCYMTGVLPIKKYSSGSALNMFDEFTFLKDRQFGEYFGFTEDEVKELCTKNGKMNYKEMEHWYNGYYTANEIKVYNPRSVVKALKNSHCDSYWTNTGAMDEVAEYLKYNTLEIRDDVIEMVSGQEIDIFIDEEFRAGQGAPRTKEEIYSAMIVLGFLSYHDGYLKIPNKELMKEFEKALRDEELFDVLRIIKDSSETNKEDSNEAPPHIHSVE